VSVPFNFSARQRKQRNQAIQADDKTREQHNAIDNRRESELTID
jgi:hypothetical protein